MNGHVYKNSGVKTHHCIAEHIPYFTAEPTHPIRPVTMLLLGDSVDRSAVWDVNGSANAAQSPGLQSVINEHWRAAIKLPNLDMVSI